jgi:hypothetical protein
MNNLLVSFNDLSNIPVIVNIGAITKVTKDPYSDGNVWSVIYFADRSSITVNVPLSDFIATVSKGLQANGF